MKDLFSARIFCLQNIFLLSSTVLGLWQLSDPASGAVDIDIFPDANHKTIPLPDASCSFIIDSTLNFSVTKIAQTIHVEALAQGTTGALLIVMCPGVPDAEYSLVYHNISSQAATTAETNPILHPDAYLESTGTRSGSGDAAWTNRWIDRTFRPAQIQIEDGRSLGDSSRSTRSFDITHAIDDDELVYYGRSIAASRGSVLESYRGGFETRFLSGGISRTFSGVQRFGDSYYASIMDPLMVQFKGRDNADGTWLRSLSKNWFFSAQEFSGRTTLAGNMTGVGREIQGAQTITRRITSGTNRSWLNLKSGILCGRLQQCKLREFTIGPSLRGREFYLSLDHQLLPHATLLLAEWKPTTIQSVMLSYRHQHRPIKCSKKLCASTGEALFAEADRDFLQTDYSIGYRFGLLVSRFDVQQPVLPAQSRRTTSISVGLGEEREAWTWDVLAAHDVWKGLKAPSILATIRVYSEYNLGRAALWMRKHSLKGVLLSSVTKAPIANAQIILTMDGHSKRQTITDADGTYAINDIPQSGTIQLEVIGANSREHATIQKDYRDTAIEKNLYIADYLTVRVRFLLDSNKNGIIDASDAPVSLNNEIPEIQDAVVTGPGATVSTDHLLFARGGMISMRLNQAMMPSRYELVMMTPERIDSTKNENAVVTVLLRESP